MRRFLLSGFLLALLGSSAFGLRIVTYNTATSGDNSSPSLPRERMSVVLQGIGNEVVEGISRPIDVLLLHEQDALNTTTDAIVDILNDLHGDGVYARGRRTGRTNGGGRGAIVYNTQTIDLVEEFAFGSLSVNAQARETLRYTLRPLGYSEDANFYAYVNHYKAGSTSTDRTRRNVEANAVRLNADRLNDGSHVIFAGDFNIQRCTEAMFQTLTATGVSQAIDPINPSGTDCNWHNNNALRQWHTQSPSDGADGFLATGGLDDRFDFQLVTDDLLDEEGLSVVPGTYRAFGNNGTHTLNQPINDRFNTGAPRTVLNALARTSDHLPVVVDYQIPAWMSVSNSDIPNRIIQGTATSLLVDIANVAPASSPNEADELNFDVVFEIDTPDNATSVSGEVVATEVNQVVLEVPTDQVRNRVYRLRASSESESVMNGEFLTSGFYSVFAPAIPSLSAEAEVTDQSIELGFLPQSQDEFDASFEVGLSLHNLAAIGQSAGLEFNSLTLPSEPNSVAFEFEPFALLQPKGEHAFSARLDTTRIGLQSSTLRLTVSDDRSISGAQTTELSVTVTANVAIPGDANGDNEVAFGDFLVVSRNFGIASSRWEEGDFDRDGQVAFGDFLALSRNFGRSAVTAVPEPNNMRLAIAATMFLILSFRRRKL